MTSVLSLAVESLRVIVRIDGEDISRADDNDGPNPWWSLVPVNRFVATGEPTTATIAGCPSCGPDCCAVEARIRREDGVVRWEWGRVGARFEADRRVALFEAGAYDAEVARFAADHDWETWWFRAGRLILTDLALPPRFVGTKVHAEGTAELEVCLEEPDEYQIFVRVPWDEERIDESAAAARAVLAGPPAHWSAQWFSNQGDPEEPPAYAGPSWRRLEI